MRSFTCPHCSGHIGFENADVGQTGMCPHCGQPATIAAPVGVPPLGGPADSHPLRSEGRGAGGEVSMSVAPTKLRLRRRRLLTRTLAISAGVSFLVGVWAGQPGVEERHWREESRLNDVAGDGLVRWYEQHRWEKDDRFPSRISELLKEGEKLDYNAAICAELSRRVKWKFWYGAGGLGLLAVLIRLKDWAW